MGVRRNIGMTLGALILVTLPLIAAAQQLQQVKVATIDLNRVYRDAAAGKNIQSQINSFAAAYRSDTEKAEAELRNAEKELASTRGKLPPEAFAEERSKLEKRVQEYQQRVQQRRRALTQLKSQGLQQVEAALKQVVDELREERSLNLILRSEQIAYADSSLDVTDEVLRRLDQKLPNVQISLPQE
jgi:Skp family chaperone for outer membrane proteins